MAIRTEYSMKSHQCSELRSNYYVVETDIAVFVQADVKAATDLAKGYMDRIRLYENQLVIYKVQFNQVW